MALTLPSVVYTVSSAISAANEIWYSLSYPMEQQYQQTQAFLARITDQAGDFLAAYQNLDKMVRQQVLEKQVSVQALAAQLEAEFQLTATSACAQFDQLCRYERLFNDEKALRADQLKQLNAELQMCCEDDQQPFTAVSSLRKSDMDAGSRRIADIRAKLRPAYDELARVTAQLRAAATALGRQESADSSQAMRMCLRGTPRLAQIGELRAELLGMYNELQQRKKQIAMTTQEVLNIQAVLQQTNTFLSGSQVENALNSVLLARIPFLMVENDFSDDYYRALMREFNELHYLLRDNKPQIVRYLIMLKTELLHDINPLYVNYETDGEILELYRYIEVIRQAKSIIQPISTNIYQFDEFYAMSRELQSIQKDTSRFTSRGREGVKMRYREESLKKELGNNFPKAVAALKFKLDQLYTEFYQSNLQISFTEVLAKDYQLEINKILQIQSKAFVYRYQQFLCAFGKYKMVLSKRDGCNYIKTPRRLSYSAGIKKSKLNVSRSGVTPVIRKRD